MRKVDGQHEPAGPDWTTGRVVLGPFLRFAPISKVLAPCNSKVLAPHDSKVLAPRYSKVSAPRDSKVLAPLVCRRAQLRGRKLL
jgi:hypothetical protein